MKFQEVILKAIAKRISWLDAAEIAGLSAWTIGQIRQKYEMHGYDGLFDQQHRKRLIHRVPLATAEKVLALYQESYADLTPRAFHRKLAREHGIRISYDWIRQALQGAGLVSLRKRPADRKLKTKVARAGQ